MKKVILFVSIVAVMVLLAGWTRFDGLMDHSGADTAYSSEPVWAQRATGSWAVHSVNVQVGSLDNTLDGKFFNEFYRVGLSGILESPDDPLDGKFFMEHYSIIK